MVEAALLTRGWHLSKEGLEQCKNGLENPNVDSIIKKALDIDLRHIGVKFLPPDLNKGKVDLLQGPYVVQIQKVRNVSAPKMNEDSGVAPSLLKLQLGDGHGTCFCLVMQTIPGISLTTSPGTKLQLKGSIPVNQGYLLLTGNNAKCLGGVVEDMVARWELQRTLAQHTRQTGGGEGGPPPWVAFGQRGKVKQAANTNNGRKEIKKSLEPAEKSKELTEQEKEFEEQRKATIEEVRKAKGQSKTFGGAGGKVAMKGKETHQRGGTTYRSNSMDSSKSNGTRDAESRPIGKDPNYRELSSSSGGFQPTPQDIQQLTRMGFTQYASVNALKKHSGNVNQAIDSLLDQNSQKDDTPAKGYAGRGDTQSRGYAGRDDTQNRGYAGRSDRGDTQNRGYAGRDDTQSRGYAGRSDRDDTQRGGYAGRSDRRTDSTRGRGGGRMGGRGRGRDDDAGEDGDMSTAPSGPSTLFDFLESKLPKDKQKGSKGDSRRNYANEQPKSVKEAGIKFVHQGKDDSSERGQRNQGDRDRDYGNRNPYKEGRDDKNRDGQRNRGAEGPKPGNKDTFKSGPGRGHDDRPPRFQKAAASPQDGNRQRNQDRFEKPDRTKTQGDTERHKPNRNFDSRNNQNYDDKRSKNYEDRGGGRRTGDDRKERNYNDRQERSENRGGGKKYDDRNDTRDSRGNRTYNDRQNPNRYEGNKTQEEGKSQGNKEAYKSNKNTKERYAGAANTKDSSQYQQPNRYTKNNYQNGNTGQESQERYGQNGSIQQDYAQQGLNNGTTSPPQQAMIAVPAPMNQPMMSQAMAMMPPPHSLPIQPLPGQPPPAMVAGGQLITPQGLIWKQGDVCQAKYWEDGKIYNAMVTAVHPSGRTCVVNFMEYGNYEEVDINDMRPAATQAWIDTSQPPPSFQPPIAAVQPQGTIAAIQPQGTIAAVPQMVYENFEGPMGATLEFRRGGQGSFRRPRDDRRVPNRATQNFYQPPPSVRR